MEIWKFSNRLVDTAAGVSSQSPCDMWPAHFLENFSHVMKHGVTLTNSTSCCRFWCNEIIALFLLFSSVIFGSMKLPKLLRHRVRPRQTSVYSKYGQSLWHYSHVYSFLSTDWCLISQLSVSESNVLTYHEAWQELESTGEISNLFFFFFFKKIHLFTVLEE